MLLLSNIGYVFTTLVNSRGRIREQELVLYKENQPISYSIISTTTQSFFVYVTAFIKRRFYIK